MTWRQRKANRLNPSLSELAWGVGQGGIQGVAARPRRVELAPMPRLLRQLLADWHS
jgi:hypothetical protein